MSKFARAILLIAMPFLVYFALQLMEPREVGVLVLVLLLLRAPRNTYASLRAMGRWTVVLGTLAAGIALLMWHGNDPRWVLAYPVFMNAVMLLVFGGSLLRPPSVIERLARLQSPDLPPQGVAYTRRITQIWCGFFLLNGLTALWTVMAASREIWVLYNGLIAYLLMGVLFAGEWAYRKRYLQNGVTP